MYIVNTKRINIYEFLLRAFDASIKTDYLAFISIIARTTDGKNIQNDLLENWTSLHDLTSDDILVFVPLYSPDKKVEIVREIRPGTGEVIFTENINIYNSYNHKWNYEFFRTDFPYNMTKQGYGNYETSVDDLTNKYKNSITTAATETAKFYGISESLLPCIVLASIWEKRIFIFNLTNHISIYNIIRFILIQFNPNVKFYRLKVARINEIKKDINSTKDRINKTNRKMDHINKSWSRQKLSLINHLKLKESSSIYKNKINDLINIIDNNELSLTINEKTLFTEFLAGLELENSPNDFILLRLIKRMTRYLLRLESGLTSPDLKNKLKELDNLHLLVAELQNELNSLNQELQGKPDLSEAIFSLAKEYKCKINRNVLIPPHFFKDWEFVHLDLKIPKYDQSLNNTSRTIIKDGLVKIVLSICDNFKTVIEDNGGFKLLYDANEKLRHESAAQLLFLSTALSFCRNRYDIDISPETNSGLGSVDFKFSVGSQKVNIEVKYSNHSRLIQGYNRQLPSYNRAEKTTDSIYLVLQTEFESNQLNKINELIKEQEEKGILSPILYVINASKQQSASKIK